MRSALIFYLYPVDIVSLTTSLKIEPSPIERSVNANPLLQVFTSLQWVPTLREQKISVTLIGKDLIQLKKAIHSWDIDAVPKRLTLLIGIYDAVGLNPAQFADVERWKAFIEGYLIGNTCWSAGRNLDLVPTERSIFQLVGTPWWSGASTIGDRTVAQDIDTNEIRICLVSSMSWKIVLNEEWTDQLLSAKPSEAEESGFETCAVDVNSQHPKFRNSQSNRWTYGIPGILKTTSSNHGISLYSSSLRIALTIPITCTSSQSRRYRQR